MRKQKRIVNIGGVKIGGDNPVAIQSMCNTDTRDVKATVNQIHELENAGCEIITLGKRILRTETAGMMLLSVLMYNMEE